MVTYNKKAIMGIGTLIIFIATILVAAVAAGVIISTSGILQQKALQVGDQTRSRLINGIDVEQIFMHADLENQFNRTANDLEVLIRPSPGSEPIQLKSVTMTVFAGEFVATAGLENSYFLELNETITVLVDDSGFVDIGIDFDEDGTNEQARILQGSPYDGIQFNISSLSVLSSNISLETDLDAAGSFSVQDIPIKTDDGMIYGYVHINGTDTIADTLAANTMRITDLFEGECTHEKVIPDEYYCYVVGKGNDDTILEYGETMFLYMRMSQPLPEMQTFELRLLPSGGRTTLIMEAIPNVLYQAKFAVFP